MPDSGGGILAAHGAGEKVEISWDVHERTCGAAAGSLFVRKGIMLSIFFP